MLRSVFRRLPLIGRLVIPPPALPQRFPTEGFNLVNKDEVVEEERLDHYRPERFYSARLGEVLRSRYQILGKLGYGAHSTAWLCRDLSKHRYVTIKICESNSLPARRELAAYQRINAVWTLHAGKSLVRGLLDHFELAGRDEHAHICLVHEPLALSAEALRLLNGERTLSLVQAKVILTHLLQTLDFLHTEVGLVHGDLKLSNIHCRVEQSDAALTSFEDTALSDPVPRKVDGDHIVYQSQAMALPERLGRPILCDLGEARIPQDPHAGILQPLPYRAPEVILGLPWSYSADIWNAAHVAWTAVEGTLLFSGEDADGKANYWHHLAQMAAVIGPAPKALLERSSEAARYFDGAGEALCKEYSPVLLEERMVRVEGKDRTGFAGLLSKMLCWVPEERETAEQLLQDPWLNGR